jgi:hypothetical protein
MHHEGGRGEGESRHALWGALTFKHHNLLLVLPPMPHCLLSPLSDAHPTPLTTLFLYTFPSPPTQVDLPLNKLLASLCEFTLMEPPEEAAAGQQQDGLLVARWGQERGGDERSPH